MRSLPALVLLLVSARLGLAQAPQPAPVALAAVQQRLSEIVSHTNFAGALWGIKVDSLDSRKTIFEHNAGKLFSPASNCKLYTVAMALERFGPDYRIHTSLYAKTRPDAAGTLTGDLVVYGRGDPTVNARLHGGNIFQALQPLVAALTNAGVHRISGDLVGDESFLRGPEFGSGWAWDDQQYYYGAEISALTIADNTVVATVRPADKTGEPCTITLDPPAPFMWVSNQTATATTQEVRTISFYRVPSRNVVYATGKMPAGGKPFSDDVPVHDPARFFVDLLAQALEKNGVKLEGKTRTVNWLDRAGQPFPTKDIIELGGVESLPLSEIVREIQKPSQNLYTDLLLAHAGETARTAQTSAARTSEELGVIELTRFLEHIGIPRAQFYFEEGSGLSRDNLAAPAATVRLLEYMARDKCAGIYTNALPLAGVDGTLRNRMRGTAAARNVRAKTGSFRWAHSLSGYLTTAAGERLVFSIMLNRYHHPDGGRAARAEIDSIAVMLAGLRERSL